MSGSSKFWVGDTMYLVDDEVYAFFEQLQTELDKANIAVKFGSEAVTELQAEVERLKTILTIFANTTSEEGLKSLPGLAKQALKGSE